MRYEKVINCIFRSVNYGAVGVVMGHELTHGFDDRGKFLSIEIIRQYWRKTPSVYSLPRVGSFDCIVFGELQQTKRKQG